MVLSKKGIIVSDCPVLLHICVSCRQSLLDKQRVNPPKFAIANGHPAPPAQILPVDIVSEGIVGISIVGAMPPMQKVPTLNKHRYHDLSVDNFDDELESGGDETHLNAISEGDDLFDFVSVPVDPTNFFDMLANATLVPDLDAASTLPDEMCFGFD
ncbi:hypothetical protein GQ600_4141 [Phytophthora cactorum]|nr:hypothetical protein GQ600_4141 [Phytophthora cactorum]